MKFKTLFIFTGLFIALYSFAQEKEVKEASKNREFVICKNKFYARNIQVKKIKTEDSVCETLYTKGGHTKSIGKGKFMGTCYNFSNNISANLEKAGWKCSDISGATVIQ